MKQSFLLPLYLLYFVGIPACTKKDQSALTQCWHNEHIEAKLYDIPVPLNAQVMQNMGNTKGVDENTIVSYEVSLGYDDIVIFYQEEMERLGWWQTAIFKGSEALLNFEKPTKYCSISIRPGKKISRVIIFISQKNYS